MAVVDGHMTCTAGAMELSDTMLLMLSDYCEQEPLPQTTRPTGTRWGGHRRCALDGTETSSSEFLLPMCRSCDRILATRILYQLIEVHQHR
jgi:ribosomal protein S14